MSNTERKLRIDFYGSCSIYLNSSLHSFGVVREEDKEQIARVIQRAYEMGKNARSREIMELLT